MIKYKSFSFLSRFNGKLTHSYRFSTCKRNETHKIDKYALHSNLIYFKANDLKKGLSIARKCQIFCASGAILAFYSEYVYLGICFLGWIAFEEFLIHFFQTFYKGAITTLKYHPETTSIEYSIAENSSNYIVPLSDLSFTDMSRKGKLRGLIKVDDRLNKVTRNMFTGPLLYQVNHQELFKNLITNNFKEVRKYKNFKESSEGKN